MKVLLDVSALMALLWKNHVHHKQVKSWVKGKELVICPITELGFIRISTGSAFNLSMEDARTALDDFLQRDKPAFLPCDCSALAGDKAPNSAKTNDWYLANLASIHGMRWATLDRDAKHPAAVLIA